MRGVASLVSDCRCHETGKTPFCLFCGVDVDLECEILSFFVGKI